MLLTRASVLFSVAAIASAPAVGQPPARPPRPAPSSPARRIADVRNRLASTAASNAEEHELASYSQRYLNEAEKLLNSGHPLQARRVADAADDCRRPIEHLQHLAMRLPPPPPHPPDDHLQQVYFRLRLCDAFLDQIPAPAPRRLLEIARSFYERALQAQQEGNRRTADEYAASTDDLTHALENLAQAYAPEASAP